MIKSRFSSPNHIAYPLQTASHTHAGIWIDIAYAYRYLDGQSIGNVTVFWKTIHRCCEIHKRIHKCLGYARVFVGIESFHVTSY